MKYIKFLLVGIFFGIILIKSEIVSWYRTYEMFRFQSIHLFGIMSSAVLTGITLLQIIKKRKIKSINNEDIIVPKKGKDIWKLLIGGTIFGLGWALTAACPGTMFVLLGTGEFGLLIVLLSAVLGTFTYGLVKDKLPH